MCVRACSCVCALAWVIQGYTKMAVISGVGVRNYYRRLGYELRGEGEFLIKDLSHSSRNSNDNVPVARASSTLQLHQLPEPKTESIAQGPSSFGACIATALLALGVHAAIQLCQR